MGFERSDALRYQRVRKAKKMTMNNNNSKTRKKAGMDSFPHPIGVTEDQQVPGLQIQDNLVEPKPSN